jgi:hypothetical protein
MFSQQRRQHNRACAQHTNKLANATTGHEIFSKRMQYWVGLKGRHLILPAHLIFAPLPSSLLILICSGGLGPLSPHISTISTKLKLIRKKITLLSHILHLSAHQILQRRHTATWPAQVSACTVQLGQEKNPVRYQYIAQFAQFTLLPWRWRQRVPFPVYAIMVPSVCRKYNLVMLQWSL